MTKCKCKHTLSRLERETCLPRTEHHTFALKSSTNTKTMFRVCEKIGSGHNMPNNSSYEIIYHLPLFAPSRVFSINKINDKNVLSILICLSMMK